MGPLKSLTTCFAALVCALAVAPSLAADVCTVRSAETIAPVVELYTSEGCSSCPPADHWLSRLKSQPAIVALAFHVDYWDRLGWKDRFSSPAYTQRQAEQQIVRGAKFSFTPQVVVDGNDRQDWYRLSTAIASSVRSAAPVAVQLARDGDRYTGTVTAGAGAPARLAAYWAVTEQGHVTTVKAGENDGATLNEDFVVRQYLPVAAWPVKADAPAEVLRFDLPGPGDPAHARLVNLVIVNPQDGRPVQAVKLGC